MNFAAAMLVAMLVDGAAGWPDRIYRRIGHPVTWIGALIRALDLRFNRAFDSDLRRRLAGVLAAVLVIVAAAGGGGTAAGRAARRMGWDGDGGGAGLAVGGCAVDV